MPIWHLAHTGATLRIAKVPTSDVCPSTKQCLSDIMAVMSGLPCIVWPKLGSSCPDRLRREALPRHVSASRPCSCPFSSVDLRACDLLAQVSCVAPAVPSRNNARAAWSVDQVTRVLCKISNQRETHSCLIQRGGCFLFDLRAKGSSAP